MFLKNESARSLNIPPLIQDMLWGLVGSVVVILLPRIFVYLAVKSGLLSFGYYERTMTFAFNLVRLAVVLLFLGFPTCIGYNKKSFKHGAIIFFFQTIFVIFAFILFQDYFSSAIFPPQRMV